jgi:hypothetical protein
MKTPKFIRKAFYFTRRNAPTILTIGGGIGVAIGFVWGCKASMKLKDEITVSSQEIAEVRSQENSTAKDLALAYAKAGGRVARLYAAPVTVEILSIGAMVGSNYILKKRNAGLAAALVTTTEAFNQYRARVRGRYGDDVDQELRYGLQKGSFEEKVVDENGNETTVSGEKDIFDVSAADACTFLFTKSNRNWEGDDDLTYVEYFLGMQQNEENNLLKIKGIDGEPLFLSEVLQRLDIRPTQASHFLGWMWDPDNKNHTGDNYVDFRPRKVKIKNEAGEYETAILLDFNCDGSVLKILPE